MSHSFARISAVAAAAAALIGVAQTGRAARSSAATPAACPVKPVLIARGQGSPDDLVWDGRTLLASDINGGTIGVVAHGHTKTLVSGIHEPEGIVPGPGKSLLVAEQATNSVLQIKLPKGSRSTLAKLPLPAGKTGVDGINAAGPGSIYVPDSARGRLYLLKLASRKLSLLASGMTRPVAAIKWGKDVAVADEYANAVWKIGPTRTRLASVAVPDDLAVISDHLVASSLLGGVWEVAPHLRLLTSAFAPATSDPQGLVADGPDSLLVADEARNGIYRLAGLSSCL